MQTATSFQKSSKVLIPSKLSSIYLGDTFKAEIDKTRIYKVEDVKPIDPEYIDLDAIS